MLQLEQKQSVQNEEDIRRIRECVEQEKLQSLKQFEKIIKESVCDFQQEDEVDETDRAKIQKANKLLEQEDKNRIKAD